jgi:hypothetical protein
VRFKYNGPQEIRGALDQNNISRFRLRRTEHVKAVADAVCEKHIELGRNICIVDWHCRGSGGFVWDFVVNGLAPQKE